MPVDTVGNSLSTARSIALTTTPSIWNEWVGAADTQDFYRFTLSASSNVNLTLTGLTNDADLQLIRDINSNNVIDSGDVLSSSSNASTQSESIVSTLNAGTYFVRVHQYIGDTNYSLTASATANIIPADLAGNTTTTARTVTLGSTAQTVTDWVGNADTTDYYKFTLANRSDISVRLDGLSADADISLRNASDVIIISSANASTSAETIARQLDAGVYYLRVDRYGSAQTTYRLTTSAIPLDTDNTIATAVSLGTLNVGTPITRTDSLSSTDLTDFSRFTLTGGSSDFYNLDIRLTGLTGDADIALIDSTGFQLDQSILAGTSSDRITRIVGAGTYYLKVWNATTSNLNYTINLGATRAPITTDWFSVNLRDSGLINAVRSVASDGILTRADMISIFRNAQDDSVISAIELTDLNTVVNNFSRWTVAENIRVLSRNLLSTTDRANLQYQGTTLGSLVANSSATQMERLINKWFLGLDRPTLTSSSFSYRAISGSLFQGGISTTDVNQGQVGDCYFLTTLGSIANEQPSYIQNMFIDNGDRTWTVRFRNGSNWDYVTVDGFLPTDSSGRLVYASQGSLFSSTSNELWVALAEKAYAQIGASGWTRGTSRTNSYASIEAGWMDYVITQVTGLSSLWTTTQSFTEQSFISLVNSNRFVTVGVDSSQDYYGLVGNHAYAVTSYNSTTGKFFVRNPWGTQHVELTWSQLRSLDLDVIYSA